MITKTKLEELVQKYETEEFIKTDPVQFPHRFKTRKDIEIAAFLASIFAYGNRKVFIKKIDELFKTMQNKPLEFVLNFDPKTIEGFNYRFAKDFDVIEVFNILKKLYKENNGLKALFEYGYKIDNSILTMLQSVTDYFYSNVKNKTEQGFYHLVPNPKNGGAMKRLNMFYAGWFENLLLT